MTKTDDILEFTQQLGKDNIQLVKSIMQKADGNAMALFSVFCYHLAKTVKVKDFRFPEFANLLDEVNLNG